MTRRFTGEGSINGVPVRVEAQASAVHATVSVVAEGKAYPDPKELSLESDGLWYEPLLVDENDLPMNLDEFEVNAESVSAGFTGNGRLPEQLRLFIGLAGEGDWWNENMEKPAPILLTPVA